jgi:hypothetical protein
MTVKDILEQAKRLSPQEREELVNRLIEMRTDETPLPKKTKTGAEIVAMLEKTGPIELMYPEIEDPVEWVKQIRRDQQKKRGIDWGSSE